LDDLDSSLVSGYAGFKNRARTLVSAVGLGVRGHLVGHLCRAPGRAATLGWPGPSWLGRGWPQPAPVPSLPPTLRALGSTRRHVHALAQRYCWPAGRCSRVPLPHRPHTSWRVSCARAAPTASALGSQPGGDPSADPSSLPFYHGRRAHAVLLRHGGATLAQFALHTASQASTLAARPHLASHRTQPSSNFGVCPAPGH